MCNERLEPDARTKHPAYPTRYGYTYFTIFYPGQKSGNFVLETGVESHSSLPDIDISYGAHTRSDDDASRNGVPTSTMLLVRGLLMISIYRSIGTPRP